MSGKGRACGMDSDDWCGAAAIMPQALRGRGPGLTTNVHVHIPRNGLYHAVIGPVCGIPQ